MNPSAAPAGRVLVVDDERANRYLIRATLEPRGYVVEEAAGGAEALAGIAAALPDVVLLDVAMPGMDGLEVCRRLKADPRTAPLPVIMVTGHADRSDRLAGMDAGANDYVTKPVDLPDLVLRVRNACAGKRLADEVRENLVRLRELEHLRDSLTQMVVHDLRTPLAAILMGLELLKLRVAPSRKSERKILEESFTSARHMREMINSLLDVSRLEAGKMTLQRLSTKLAPLISDVLDSVRSLAENRHIALAQRADGAAAYCDGSIVRRVLDNLVDNALRFTPTGGEVRVAAASEGAVVRVTVRDTGVGIAPEYHKKIFEKFGQVETDHSRVGTGLGLTFCRLAVEAHGGRIGVESASGSGSTFWFTLPAA